jgi:hypothetical protein
MRMGPYNPHQNGGKPRMRIKLNGVGLLQFPRRVPLILQIHPRLQASSLFSGGGLSPRLASPDETLRPRLPNPTVSVGIAAQLPNHQSLETRGGNRLPDRVFARRRHRLEPLMKVATIENWKRVVRQYVVVQKMEVPFGRLRLGGLDTRDFANSVGQTDQMVVLGKGFRKIRSSKSSSSVDVQEKVRRK